MPSIPSRLLNDGNQIPQLGFGTWQIPDAETPGVVGNAFELGYRHIDGAAAYQNEEGLGRAIRDSDLARSDLYITTKLRNPDQGRDKALTALEASLSRLGLEYVDLYLIHWPCPGHDRFVETWQALVEARDAGLARSIGVSNFRIQDIERVIDATGVVPAVNQIELHPFLQQRELRAFSDKLGIVTESWSPLAHGGELLTNQFLLEIADKHQKTVAQVILRWHVQLGLVAIPKSVTASRMAQNIDVFDFSLDADDMAKITAIDAGKRLGPDPADFEDMS